MHNHREPHDVAALAKVVRGEGVAEPVPAEHRQTEFPLHQVKRRVAVALLPPRSAEPGEEEVALDALLDPELLKPIEALAEFWRERHEPLLLALAEHFQDEI